MPRLRHLRMSLIGLTVAASVLLLRRIPGAVFSSPLLLTVGLGVSMLLWRRRSEYLWLGLLLALCGLALLRCGPLPPRQYPRYANDVVVEGRVCMDSSASAVSDRIFLEVTRDPSGLFRAGDKLRMEREEKRPLGWDDKLVLRGDLLRYRGEAGGCDGRIRVKKIERYEPTRSLLARSVNRLRRSFVDFCLEDVGGRERGRLLAGLLMGDASLLGGESTVAIRRAGLSHTCAASGMHVAVIIGLISALGKKLRLSRGATFLFTSLLLAYYVMVAGGRSPILRASLLVPISFGAWLSGSRYHSLSALGLILALLVLWDPRITGELSFQLTFSAAFGIVLFTGPIMDALGARGGGVAKLTACTMAAQLATLPLIASKFGEVSLVATFSNLMVLPLMPLVMGAGMAGGLLRALKLPLSRPLGVFAGFMAEIILRCGKLLSAPGWSTLETGGFPVLITALYVTALLVVMRKGTSRKARRIFLAALLAAVLLTCCGRVLTRAHGESLVFFDVGQGDSFIFQSDGGVRILVDGGESEATLRKKLRKYGIRHLDLIILSHPDEDHVGGLDAALWECTVGAILETGSVGGRAYLEWREAVEEEGAVSLWAQAGYKLRLGDVVIEVIAPEAGAEDDSGNCNSLICRISSLRLSVLATGDAEEAEEDMVLQSGAGMGADILKVPHHGGYSSLSREFFKKARMMVAVISVGENNRYGHPHPDTLASLEETGCLTCRTDQLGDIIVEAREGGKLVISGSR